MKELINYTEIAAGDYLDKHLAKTEVCQCEECRLDITAIMLNKLKPHYVVSESGVLFAKLQQLSLQHSVDFAVVMAEAVEIVKNNPRAHKN